MSKINTLIWAVAFTACLTLLTACQEPASPIGKNISVDPSIYSDFSTMYACPVEINIDGQALISIYDVDPATNPDAKPIYATFTDKSGHYKGKMQLPEAHLGQTLYCTGFGYEATAKVEKNGVKFSATFADPRSRAEGDGSTINHIYNDDELVAECKRLYGLYLQRLPESHNNTSKLTETENLAIHTLKDDTEIFFSFVNSGGRYPSQLYYFYFPEEVDATEFVKQRLIDKYGEDTDLSSLALRTEFMRFFTNDAADPNKKFLLTRDWGVFYTHKKQYKSGENAKSDGEKYVVLDSKGNRLYGNGFVDAPTSLSAEEKTIFENEAKANNIIEPYVDKNGVTHYPTWDQWYYPGYGYVNRNFNNHIGAHHHLRYYGPNYDEYLDEPNYDFPAGYRIGFILKVKDTDHNSISCLTSNNALNKNGAVQCARNLSISPNDRDREITNIVYGFEDQLLENGSDKDYNDFIFLISASPAVSTVGIETVVDEGELFLDGTLLYEDLYPDAGDYDMNDVMVEYEMWVRFDKDNYVTSIESTFWPINYGADYEDDFYMELATDDNQGHHTQYVAPELTIPSAQLISLSRQNLQEIKAGKRPTHSVMHRHEFTAASQKLHRDSVRIENFNPFIYVHNTRREVHLTNGAFRGVNEATTFGLSEDEKKYYPLMIKDGSLLDGCYFPYAMNVPLRFSSVSMEGFTPVTERINIGLEYTMYLDWMREPNNPQYKAWYKIYSKWAQ